AKWKTVATSIVSAKNKLAGLLQSPMMTNIAPSVSVNAANPPQTMGKKLMPRFAIESPIFFHSSGPPIILGNPWKANMVTPVTTRKINSPMSLLLVLLIKIILSYVNYDGEGSYGSNVYHGLL